MNQRTQTFPITLSSGDTIYAEVTVLGGEEEVAFESLKLDGALSSLKDIGTEVRKAIEYVKPNKATVEFGLKLSVGSGKLGALLVDGKSDASLKVSLQWETN